MIFHQWKDISNSNNLYIIVNNDYKLYNDIDQNTNLYDRINKLEKISNIN